VSASGRERETGPVAASSELLPRRVRRTFEMNAGVGVVVLLVVLGWNLSLLTAWAPVVLVGGVVLVALFAAMGVVLGLPALLLAQVLDAASPRRSESDPQLSRVVASVAILPVAGLAWYFFSGWSAPLLASMLTLQLPALVATVVVRVPLETERVTREPVDFAVCAGCGYDRVGLPGGAVCPECGARAPGAVESGVGSA
jgi:hypothetical protein